MIQGSNHGPPSRRFSLLDTSWRHRIVSLLLQHVTQCGSGSVVEHLLAKEKVAGSNPVFRSLKATCDGLSIARILCQLTLKSMAFWIRRRILCPDAVAGVAERQTLRS